MKNTLGRITLAALAMLLTACAGVGSTLTRGKSSLPEVIASMGEPAMRWHDGDGREQLAYPKGPAGTDTFMAFIDANGRLERLEAVLNWEHFARIERGSSDKASVLRLLGPSIDFETRYYDRRNELVWSWRFCNEQGLQTFFDVLFDASSGQVRSTQQRADLIPGMEGDVSLPCGAWPIGVK